MKKQRLQVDFEFDFDVYGIVSTFKDYKLVWNINRNLHVSLRKEQDLKINFVDSQLVISHYKYTTEGSELQLLRNKSYELSGGESQYMIPEMPKIDFFMMVQGDINGYDRSELKKKLKETPGVEFILELNIADLKSRENFIF